MSEELLTPDQIAALFGPAGEDNLPAEPSARDARRARWLRKIDFTRPTKFSPDQENRLRRAHEGWCRLAVTRLSAEHRIPIDLEVIDISQLTWNDAHGVVPRDAICATLDVEPIGTKLVLGVEQPLLLAWIERLLGSPDERAPRKRKLTDIDLALVRRVFEVLSATLSATWLEMAGVRLSCGRIEPQPEVAQLMAASEPTLALTIEARMNGSASTAILLLPHASVQPVQSAYSKRVEIDHGPDPAAAMALRAGLGEVDVTVRAELGAVTLTMDRVLALRPGDTVHLGVPAAGDVSLWADQVVVHQGKAGRSGRRRAVQVLDGGGTRG